MKFFIFVFIVLVVLFFSIFGADAPKKMWQNTTSDPIEGVQLHYPIPGEELDNNSYGLYDFFGDIFSLIFIKGPMLGLLLIVVKYYYNNE